ncbi:hypothetical protein [Sphingomonas solaris]|uniref:TonB C-terminal domain-containing protein n=1 Tax=Alterirhizorhabdus solaris TaxID=2529389 RepID=A0A558QZS0_9SPHN|nr:hypothetical protein [Sphingomonas solaris]TVV72588.1 hypothetical protein FOY91_14120 [Sphingomonas solaris]
MKSIALAIMIFTHGAGEANGGISETTLGFYPPVLQAGHTLLLAGRDGTIADCDDIADGRLQWHSPICRTVIGTAVPHDATPAFVIGEESKWVEYKDLPRIYGPAGAITLFYGINEHGRVDTCTVMDNQVTVEHAQATCAALVKRARYRPVMNAGGQHIRSARVQKVRWGGSPF